jgi:hypothetical protein
MARDCRQGFKMTAPTNILMCKLKHWTPTNFGMYVRMYVFISEKKN